MSLEHQLIKMKLYIHIYFYNFWTIFVNFFGFSALYWRFSEAISTLGCPMHALLCLHTQQVIARQQGREGEAGDESEDEEDENGVWYGSKSAGWWWLNDMSNFTCSSLGIHLYTSRTSVEHQLNNNWTPLEHHLSITWTPLECQLNITWASLECHLDTTWISLEYHLATTWPPRGYH